MSKQKRVPKNNRHPIRQRQRSGGADYWPDELENRLNGFGASSRDLLEIDPDSCQTEKQHQHALRVRGRFLVHPRLKPAISSSLHVRLLAVICFSEIIERFGELFETETSHGAAGRYETRSL